MNRRQFLGSSVAAAVALALTQGRALAEATPVSGAIEAVTGDGAKKAIEADALKQLKASLRGALILPGEPGYDVSRRVINVSIDRHPALVIRPSGVADIRTAVQFASEHDLLLAVKCGGHSYSGKSTCDGGMQIDLSTFRGVHVDPAQRVARVAGGSLLGELDHEALAFGLVTTAGTVSHTGVGGLTLGGGFGRLARRFGLALDNVRAVELVTADGRLLRASGDENSDLYWAVRGGGGNFGIVTAFEFDLHPMQRTIHGGDIVFPLKRARELLKFYAEHSLAAPDDLYLDAVMDAPMGGKDGSFVMHACYSGPANKADAVLAPLRKLGKPIADTIKPVDYAALQRSWDQTDARNTGEYLKSGFIDTLSDDIVRKLLDGFEAHADRGTTVFFQHAGGAIARIATDATAFPHRPASHNMFAVVSWPLAGDPTPHVKYIKDYWATVEGHTNGYYTNEVADEAQHFVDENYQGNFARLQQIKTQYDPRNRFRLNANVKPLAST
jgi:FAD/FMN-containing dehydrogenase